MLKLNHAQKRINDLLIYNKNKLILNLQQKYENRKRVNDKYI